MGAIATYLVKNVTGGANTPTMVNGFETAPLGRLIKQVLSLESDMGLAYERSIGFQKPDHTHDRDMLVCPRGATRVEITAGEESFSLGSTFVLFVPRGLVHETKSLSTIYDVMALLPSQGYVSAMINDNGLASSDEVNLKRTCRKLKRSRWLDDLIERYFFERVVNHASPPGCPFFLEKQLMNEFARLVFGDKLFTMGDNLGEQSDLVADKLWRFLEANLFEKIELLDACNRLNVSPSTALRSFRKQFGMPPKLYLKQRRLDEAAALLSRGEYRVADICTLVGYEDLSSFNKAFRAKFGVPPSHYR